MLVCCNRARVWCSVPSVAETFRTTGRQARSACSARYTLAKAPRPSGGGAESRRAPPPPRGASERLLPDGALALAYDPGIADNVKKEVRDIDLWSFWDKVSCPTLVFRGAESDLLSAGTALEMTKRGPRARVVTFSGVGHAPALMAEDQIEIVAGWLASPGGAV